jgi:response regulator RpfG family c-di-GMP phosphodiesterase
MLEARRDLEVQIENLEARMRTVQSEAVASQVDFDESHVARCEELINSLRSRLQVAERLMSQDESSDIPRATSFNVGKVSVVDEIDHYFAESSPSDNTLSSLN